MFVVVRNPGLNFPGVITVFASISVGCIGVWFHSPQIDAREWLTGIGVDHANIRDGGGLEDHLGRFFYRCFGNGETLFSSSGRACRFWVRIFTS